MKRLATVTCITGILVALVAGCSTTVVEVRESYLPLEPGRPYKLSYRRSGEVCGSRTPGASWVADAIATMTQNSDKIDNVLGLHVETKSSLFSQCVAVSGYPVLYVDNQPKRSPFSRRMMSGPSGGGEASPSTPMYESPPVVGASPTPTPTPGPSLTPTPTPTPTPASTSSAPTQAECEAKCARFSGIWKGSAAIQGTIRRNCIQKCLKPEKKAYRDCIDAAASIEDIGKCNNL
ncbi:MAG: hypothetical protein ABIK09_07960 [Pseudomonadota bacterium]